MPELHPENYDIWAVYQLIQTQMRVSAGGDFLGYDMATIPFIVQAMGLPQFRWLEVFEGIALINTVAIKVAHSSAKD